MLQCRGKNGCGEFKQPSFFYPSKAKASGYQAMCIDCTKAYKLKRAEEIRAKKRAWTDRNKLHLAAYDRKYKELNPEIKLGIKHRYRSLASKGMTAEDISVTAAYRKAIKNDPCFYCSQYSEVMEDDHKIPVSRGGTDHWWNLVRACFDCNRAKSSKIADEFITHLAGVS